MLRSLQLLTSSSIQVYLFQSHMPGNYPISTGQQIGPFILTSFLLVCQHPMPSAPFFPPKLDNNTFVVGSQDHVATGACRVLTRLWQV